MKRFLKSPLTICFLLASFLFLGSASLSSCKTKSGCPINDEAHFKPGKDGKMPMTGGRSQLFPKQMRKKMKRNK